IIRGLAELAVVYGDDPASKLQASRIRRPGGGRKKLTEIDPTLLSDLRGLVEPATRGDPEAALLWTSRSLRNLADALRAMGHRISHYVVADLLRDLNYSLQANRKTREGTHNPDRDAQFGYINAQVAAALATSEPAISVDTKKKELGRVIKLVRAGVVSPECHTREQIGLRPRNGRFRRGRFFDSYAGRFVGAIDAK